MIVTQAPDWKFSGKRPGLQTLFHIKPNYKNNDRKLVSFFIEIEQASPCPSKIPTRNNFHNLEFEALWCNIIL